MFWGLITEPNKRYTQVVEKPFHISQAAMDTSTGDTNPCQVMVVVEGKNYLVCTLQKTKCIQVPLDLYFKSGESVSFLTNGKSNIHLTGYLDPELEEELSDEEESEDEEEETSGTQESLPSKFKRKLENSFEVLVSQNKKPKQEKKAKKTPSTDDSSDSDEESEDQLQKLLDGEDVDSDENDESFKINTSIEESGSDEESDEEGEDDEEDEEEEDDDEDGDEEDDSSGKADTSLDTSKDEKTVDTSKLSKSQKKRLKKKQKEQAAPQTNGIDKMKKEKPDETQVAKSKQEKKGESKKPVQEVAEKKEKKTLSGGVFVEDLKVGSGPVAKSGKTVMVYYEGRLKQNNKVFDNCLKGPGFKFKLGSKEVISGWDVGVAGMKVGGKRKIVCPPAMGYGAKGSPPVIPPNSTLVFEVELKNVK